ncbi:efflux RND transporter periplasmic adaptor subunit [Verrucomicrobium sp. BvORR034]|jgi:HlyD family secretion protein|uniref:efflux RND transporter periplasmic adaptor subunit n=1 Tax=Verrucomicrobium sp. BvORR034 TaxID=1396418 RepID=UPI000678E72A|nr:efflux RND transporter periplasmic adaptor subunit [Verrucomicrobium sp. BvORR034]
MKATAVAPPQDLADVIHANGSRKSIVFRLFLILLLIGAGAGAWYWWQLQQQAQNQISPYTTEAVRKGEIRLTVTATGNLEPTNEVTIGSELSGTTLEVYVDINDRVKKGQPLAKLDTTKLEQQTESSRATVVSAKAKVAQVQATLKESEATLSRLKDLQRISNGKMPAQADMDAAIAATNRDQADLLAAEASVKENEAQVKINERDLEKAVIKSPIDGIVLTRSLEPGQTVAASFTAPELFVLAENLELMELNVAVAEADIGRVAAGQKATFTVDAWPDRSFSANVRRVSFGSVVTDNVVTYQTELEVSNKDLSLRPGMTATADIHVAESKDAFLVPTAALRFDPTASTQSSGPPQEKKSFVQNLMPGPRRFSSNRPRSSEGGGPGGGPGGGGGREKRSSQHHDGMARIWILKDGQPVALDVKAGLSDGRNTEVSGEGVSEGLQVIIRANIPSAS